MAEDIKQLRKEEMLRRLESDLERVEKVKKRLLREPFNRIGSMSYFGGMYEQIGIEYIVGAEDITEGRKAFYKSMVNWIWVYEHYNKNQDVCRFPTRINSESYRRMYFAVISGDWDIAIKIAGYYFEFQKLDFDSREEYSVELCNVMKYLILDRDEECKSALEKLESLSATDRHYKKMVEGQAIAVRGLLTKDEELFNKGLLQVFKNHEAKVKREGNGIYGYFCYDGVALAMIGMRRGFNITIEHEKLKPEYLEKSDIDYSQIVIDKEIYITEEEFVNNKWGWCD